MVSPLPIFRLSFCPLDRSRRHLGGGGEEQPPSDWMVAMSLRHFLNNKLMGEGQCGRSHPFAEGRMGCLPKHCLCTVCFWVLALCSCHGILQCWTVSCPNVWCVHVYRFIYGCSRMCAVALRGITCLPPSISILFSEARSLTGPAALCFSWTGCPASSQKPAVSVSAPTPVWELQTCHAWFLHDGWGSELRLSYTPSTVPVNHFPTP